MVFLPMLIKLTSDRLRFTAMSAVESDEQLAGRPRILSESTSREEFKGGVCRSFKWPDFANVSSFERHDGRA